MSTNGRDAYLQTQVLTATPQKLRLMLIDGAIRQAHQILQFWEENNFDQAMQSLTRCREIISELLSSIKSDGSEITQKTSGIYIYLFRTLTESQVEKQRKCIEDVISVLEVERNTWRQLCEQMPDAPDRSGMAENEPKEITVSNSEAILTGPHAPATSFEPKQSSTGFDSSSADVPPAPAMLPENLPNRGSFSLDA